MGAIQNREETGLFLHSFDFSTGPREAFFPQRTDSKKSLRIRDFGCQFCQLDMEIFMATKAAYIVCAVANFVCGMAMRAAHIDVMVMVMMVITTFNLSF